MLHLTCWEQRVLRAPGRVDAVEALFHEIGVGGVDVDDGEELHVRIVPIVRGSDPVAKVEQRVRASHCI